MVKEYCLLSSIVGLTEMQLRMNELSLNGFTIEHMTATDSFVYVIMSKVKEFSREQLRRS
jgi:hypothetical protein